MAVLPRMLRLFIVPALAGCTACGGLDLSGPGKAQPLPESHPQPIDAVALSEQLVWSPDGNEIAYISSDIKTAYARNASTGARRTLYAASDPEYVAEIAFSAIAPEWFTVTYIGAQAEGGAVRRHTLAGSELITNRGAIKVGGPVGGHLIMAATNGDFAYVVRADSLFLWRTTSSTPVFLGAGCPSIAAISPSATDVVCFDSQSPSDAVRFSTNGVAPASIYSSLSSGRLLRAVWNDQGLFFLSLSLTIDQYVLQRYGDAAPLITTPKVSFPEELSFGTDVSLAANGRGFSFANNYCAQVELFSCPKNQNIVYAADADSHTTKRLAVQTSNTFGITGISPDGSRVAYVMDGQLYLVSAR